jgi:PAS domain S-box-containing protein
MSFHSLNGHLPQISLQWVLIILFVLQIVTSVGLVGYFFYRSVSARKQANEALRQSETRFQQWAALSPGYIYTVVADSNGPIRYEYISPAFEEILELRVEEALQDASITFKHIHPEDVTSYQQAIARSCETMQLFRHEWRIITPAGKIKWIQANSRPERRKNGEVVWHGVANDVTERKQTEHALQQALQQIDSHFENSPLAIIQWNKNFQILRWSKQAERIFGWTAEEVKARSWQDWQLVYEGDRDRVNTLIEPLLNGQVTGRAIQNRNYTTDGRVIVCQWYSSAVFDEMGNLVSVLSFAQDVSDYKQAESELRQHKELRETIFNESTDAIFLVDPKTLLVIDCNRRAVELFEMESKDNLIGIAGHTLQKQPFTQEELDEIVAQMQQKGFWSQEIEYITRKGNHFWGNLAAKPIQIAEQRLNLVRVTDISERHKLDRIKDEFISIVSHELRTPLTSVRGALGILETGVLNEEPETAQRMLLVALKNTERLMRLVNDILAIERLELNKEELVMQACNVSDLLEEAVSSVQGIAAQANIAINVTSVSAQVWAAPDAIIQTIINLLGNAIKFSPTGSTIWLTAELGNGDNSIELSEESNTRTFYVLFSVKDTGRGIPDDKLETIFGRFQQVDVSDSRQKGGTGLGLAICKSIIDQHHGKIWVESVLGEGSTFYFTLERWNQKL